MKPKFTTAMVTTEFDAQASIARTNRFFSPELTGHDIAARLGCSYSTAHRLIKKLVEGGVLQVRWTHQHQSYWEAWYSLKENSQ